MENALGIIPMLRTGKLRRNKRGSLLDIVFYGLVMTFFAIVVIIGMNIAGEINDKINDMPDTFNENSIKSTNEVITKATYSLDSTFLLFSILLGIFTLVLAALVRVHPIFIPFFFIAWLLIIFIGGIYSNIYQGIADSTELAGTVANFAFLHFIMTYMPMIIGIFGILIMAVMYKLWQIEQ